MHDTLPLTIALIVMAGMLAQWLAWRLKLPSILFLLVLGLVLGPVGNVLDPDALFGDLLFPVVSLGVALVLFEGALTLRFSDLRGHGPSVSHLVTWGALLNWLLIAGGAWLVTPFQWPTALLFGALVVVTGPTVIVPLLRTVKPNAAVSNILRWEGILIDPIGALLAVIVFEAIIAGTSDNPLLFLARELMVGGALGVLAALGLAQIIQRHWLPEYLHNVFTLALVLLVFAVSNHLASESGLLAVTVMGLWLANTKGLDIEEILSFKESLSVLIISVLFIALAARLDPASIIGLGWSAVAVLAVVLLARPVMVFLSTLGSGLNWREKTLLSWIAPRGIVAAAVSALFALRLESAGFEQAALLPALTFLVIIATVLIQSVSARPLALALGVAGDDRGVMIVGGNPVAIAVARVLKDLDYPVTLTTTEWAEARAARMAGIRVYYGNPVSAHADRHLDLVGIGRLFAMSRRGELNTLAALKYQAELGRARVFTLRNADEQDSTERGRMSQPLRTARLFGEAVSIEQLEQLIGQGAEIKVTTLSEEYRFEDFERQVPPGRRIMLFAVDPRQRLRVFGAGVPMNPGKGWSLIYLNGLDESLETEATA